MRRYGVAAAGTWMQPPGAGTAAYNAHPRSEYWDVNSLSVLAQ